MLYFFIVFVFRHYSTHTNSSTCDSAIAQYFNLALHVVPTRNSFPVPYFPVLCKSFLTLCFTCHQTNGCQTVLAITRFFPIASLAGCLQQPWFPSPTHSCNHLTPHPLIPAFSLFSSPSLSDQVAFFLSPFLRPHPKWRTTVAPK